MTSVTSFCWQRAGLPPRILWVCQCAGPAHYYFLAESSETATVDDQGDGCFYWILQAMKPAAVICLGSSLAVLFSRRPLPSRQDSFHRKHYQG
jgi:hypothetical protein